MNTYSHIQQDPIAAALNDRKVTWQSGGLSSIVKGFRDYLFNHWHRYRLNENLRSERLELLSLTDEQLADIGISRAAAFQESQRAWGDVPNNRKITD